MSLPMTLAQRSLVLPVASLADGLAWPAASACPCPLDITDARATVQRRCTDSVSVTQSVTAWAAAYQLATRYTADSVSDFVSYCHARNTFVTSDSRPSAEA